MTVAAGGAECDGRAGDRRSGVCPGNGRITLSGAGGEMLTNPELSGCIWGDRHGQNCLGCGGALLQGPQPQAVLLLHKAHLVPVGFSRPASLSMSIMTEPPGFHVANVHAVEAGYRAGRLHDALGILLSGSPLDKKASQPVNRCHNATFVFSSVGKRIALGLFQPQLAGRGKY
ncbi:Uncharacterised protein [Klebsiella pneumoniae]|uniref:Uncharacterized protein n=1 Tax=Klebsiella pneumoniae TaxID=573 RepID=A0A378FRJ0_KLEPN|nr:Uncharacterised protein [Klebsiella pneumoniae]